MSNENADVLIANAAESATEWTPGLVAFTVAMGLGAASLSFVIGTIVWNFIRPRR